MRLGHYKFALSRSLLLLAIPVLLLLISLGFWQLNRADEKQRILAGFSAGAGDAPISALSLKPDADINRRVTVQGEPDLKHQFLLDNRVNAGRAGYEVITPVVLPNGKTILVNRGWMPMGYSREHLPRIPVADRDFAVVEGVYTRPSSGYTIGDAVNTMQDNWPKLLQYLDYEQISGVLGRDVTPGVIQVLEPGKGLLAPTWKPVAFGPEKHIGYALQWFAMAVVFLLMVIAAGAKRMDKNK